MKVTTHRNILLNIVGRLSAQKLSWFNWSTPVILVLSKLFKRPMSQECTAHAHSSKFISRLKKIPLFRFNACIHLVSERNRNGKHTIPTESLKYICWLCHNTSNDLSYSWCFSWPRRLFYFRMWNASSLRPCGEWPKCQPPLLAMADFPSCER